MSLEDIVDRLVQLNDDNLVEEVKNSNDVQWCLSELQDLLEVIGDMNDDRLRELLKADEEGRVVLLPCKVGDILYKVSSVYTECTIYQVRKDNYCCEGCEVPCDSRKVIVIEEIRPSSLLATIRCCEELGKTVFCTREEAEQALEAKRNV